MRVEQLDGDRYTVSEALSAETRPVPPFVGPVSGAVIGAIESGAVLGILIVSVVKEGSRYERERERERECVCVCV